MPSRAPYSAKRSRLMSRAVRRRFAVTLMMCASRNTCGSTYWMSTGKASPCAICHTGPNPWGKVSGRQFMISHSVGCLAHSGGSLWLQPADTDTHCLPFCHQADHSVQGAYLVSAFLSDSYHLA